MESFFAAAGAGVYRATKRTRGPWSSEFMHAGPPTALLAHACTEALQNPGMRLGRIAVEILAPVPVGDVVVTAQVLRPGSQIALVEAALSADGRPVMLARVWYLRRQEPLPVPVTQTTDAPTSPGVQRELPPGWGRGYLDSVDWRWVQGGLDEPGPATVWARPLVALIEGEQASPVERLLMVADSASGISSLANPTQWLYVNLDLTVHLRRDPDPESIWMQAESRLDGNGSGVASGVIGDRAGDVARTEQVLFVQPIRPTP